MASHVNFLTAKRRSVRRYAPQSLSSEAIADIVEAGLRAPTSKNNRATHFVLVEDKEMLQKLSECRASGSAFLADAALAIVVCSNGDKSARPYIDGAIAASYMQLAITDLDLGSCWCHITDTPSADGERSAEEYVRELLGLPENSRILCALGVGEVAEFGMLEPRQRPTEWERVYVEKYEERNEPK